MLEAEGEEAPAEDAREEHDCGLCDSCSANCSSAQIFEYNSPLVQRRRTSAINTT
jgi:hypothetical protein